MNYHSPAIGMAIHPAGSSEPPIDEAILFECPNQFSDWCIAKLLEHVRRDHRVIVTTGASTTLTPS
jgi:hypothetical protein